MLHLPVSADCAGCRKPGSSKFRRRCMRGPQVKVLSARFLRSWWRSPVNLVVQAAQYLFFAFLIGPLRCIANDITHTCL